MPNVQIDLDAVQIMADHARGNILRGERATVMEGNMENKGETMNRRSVRRVASARLFTRAYLTAVFVLSLVSQAMAGGPTAASLRREPEPIDGIMIKLRDPARHAIRNYMGPLQNRVAGYPLRLHRAMSGGVHVLKLPKKMRAEEVRLIAKRLAADPNVEYAEPDIVLYPQFVPNDPRYNEQWHYFEPVGGIDLPAAWDLTKGSSHIVIAVVDTGILPNHQDLSGRTLPGYDFISEVSRSNDGDGRDPDASDPGDFGCLGFRPDGTAGPLDSTWHGTHVAGTIGAATNNGIGVAGINGISNILPIRVMGKCGGLFSDIIDGMRWAAGLPVPGVPVNPHPAHVLNLSIGGFTFIQECPAAIQDPINEIKGIGKVIVVAAGNDASPADSSIPGNCNGVITVAATNRRGQKAWYSNRGPLVEISAPGGETRFPQPLPPLPPIPPTPTNGVLSTLNSGATVPAGDSYQFYQGTSMATPHVTGVVSLMLSINPDLNPDQVLQILQSTARPFPVASDCTTAICGAGIVDAAAAVRAAQTSLSTPVLPGARTDVNGDTRADLVWRHRISGEVALWLQNGFQTLDARVVRTVPLEWQIVGIGDVNGDTKADLIWRHQTSGEVALWLMNGVNVVDTRVIATVPLEWQVVGTGDMNSDGHVDLIWRHRLTGDVALWLQDGFRTLDARVVQIVPLEWQIVGIGDVNGDQRADLIWRHQTTGEVALWLQDGFTTLDARVVSTVPLEWSLATMRK